MKLFKKYFKRIPTTVKAAILGLVILAIPAAVIAGFGPDRPVFDWNTPADQKGSLIGPVFNSFVHTPTYGDERNLARVAVVVPGQAPTAADFRETADATAGQEYWIRTFVHNNANQTTNCLPVHKDANGNCTQVDPTAPGIAKNTRLRIEIAQGNANGVDVMSTISADNAKDKNGNALPKVWDTATLANGSQVFSVSYVNGSAEIFNQAHQSGLAIPNGDQITSANGVPIGFDQMNGDLPGCFEFSGYVYVKVKVNVPTVNIKKEVKVGVNGQYGKSAEANKGDTIDWKLNFGNHGTADVQDVTVRDPFPAGVTLVPGSIKWFDANHQSGKVLQDTALGSGGVNLGNYAPVLANQTNGYITFSTKVNDDIDKQGCMVPNTGFIRAKDVAETSDKANVTIKNCQTTVTSFSCDLLNINKGANRTVTISQFNTSATNGATFKDATIKWGDSTTALVTNNPVGQSHVFAANQGGGPFNIVAEAHFTVNGTDQTAPANANCAKVVSYCTTPGKENFPPEAPECKPTALVNTGPGDVLGIFAAVTVLGAVLHRMRTLHKLS